MNKDYWQGVWETCQYFRDELGIQDACQTNMAEWAKDELGIKTVECPNHEGAFDCTPFCPLCEGNQEYEEKQ